MLKFELKKIIKKKYFLILTIFSLLVSLVSFFYNKSISSANFQESIVNSGETIYYNLILNYVDLSSEDNQHLSRDQAFQIEQESNDLFNNLFNYLPYDNQAWDEFDSKEYNRVYNEAIIQVDNIIKKMPLL